MTLLVRRGEGSSKPSHAGEEGVDDGGEIDAQPAVNEERAKHNPKRFATIDKTKDLEEDKEKRSNRISLSA